MQFNRRHVVAGLAALPWLAQANEKIRHVALARGLRNPWALAFLPDGRMLVTERPGDMRIVEPGGRIGAPLQGVPAVDARGQGGLLDVALHPRFASNRLVYWSYAERDPNGKANGTAVARGRLGKDDARLEDVRVIFRQHPKIDSAQHFGSRLVFMPDEKLFVTLGDRFSQKDAAQTLDNHIGKIVRIDDEGRAPADNPFVGRDGARPEIWSFGHRNIQGAALHPTTGELWITEHGPQGGDELNRVQRGGNHGWPRITYGRNYGSGTVIGEGTEAAGIVAPVRHWVPLSIAPSGLAFLRGKERYPAWQGQLFSGALRAQVVVRLELDGNAVRSEHKLLNTLHERIRDVREGPDGWLYVLTDSPDGRILRLETA